MILNIIAITTKELGFMMRKFSPVDRMIISRDSGLLNDYFSIVKGQLIDLYHFSTIGEMENDQPEMWLNSKGEWTTIKPRKRKTSA